MGSGQKFLTRVESIFRSSGQLGQPSMAWVWIWKISPKNVKFSIFFPSGQVKKYQPLIYCGSKVYLGRVGPGPISTLQIPHNYLTSRKEYKMDNYRIWISHIQCLQLTSLLKILKPRAFRQKVVLCKIKNKWKQKQTVDVKLKIDSLWV